MKKIVFLGTAAIVSIVFSVSCTQIEACGQWDVTRSQSNISFIDSKDDSYIHFPVRCDSVRDQTRTSPYLAPELQDNSSLNVK